jgi:hypothetical protein
MKNIAMIQKLAVLQCIYQMIASSDGSIESWRDNVAIDYALTTLGLTTNFSWNMAINLDPLESFKKVAQLDPLTQFEFRDLLYKIADMGGNTIYRKNCAQQILQHIGWS